MRIGIIVRGLPGSGKTTLALALKESLKTVTTVNVVENDLVRKVLNTEYLYDPSDYDTVRSVTRGIVRGLLEQGHLVIVSNVFSTLESLDNVVGLFDRYLIINCTGAGESIYEVSAQHLNDLKEQWESHSSELFYNPGTSSIEVLVDYITTGLIRTREL